MNPATNNNDSNNLPRPVSGVDDSVVSADQTSGIDNNEQTTGNIELPQTSSTIAPPTVQSQISSNNKDISVASTSQIPFTDTNSTNQDNGHGTSLPVIADDNDLIEQEWIDKAKAIIDRTREDPHLQNKEINEVKADYIKKRYNKEINVNKEE